MRRKCCLFMALTVLMSFFIGCSHKTPTKTALQITGAYAVPGMFQSELKGGVATCNILEEDAYGRILFEYQTENSITGKTEKALVISQKFDSDHVYFYEDICFHILHDSEEYDREQLKCDNDWNHPLAEENISKRKYAVSIDLVLNIGADFDAYQIERCFAKALDVDRSQIKDRTFIDFDRDGKILMWMRVVKADETEAEYFVMADSSYQVVYTQMSDVENYISELITFKQEHHWSY